jgi:predicted nucleotidyltransferase
MGLCSREMDAVSTISEILKKQITDSKRSTSIVAVYLFGSCISCDGRETSDIDLAFLLDEDSYKSDPVVTMSPAYLIAAQIGMKLDKETDVTILNSSSLEIAYEVITTGKFLFEFDPEMRIEYELKIKGMYFDFRPFLEELRAKSLAQL